MSSVRIGIFDEKGSFFGHLLSRSHSLPTRNSEIHPSKISRKFFRDVLSHEVLK